jgi:hypothetical protein
LNECALRNTLQSKKHHLDLQRLRKLRCTLLGKIPLTKKAHEKSLTSNSKF